jgi:hypothetical protein
MPASFALLRQVQDFVLRMVASVPDGAAVDLSPAKLPENALALRALGT